MSEQILACVVIFAPVMLVAIAATVSHTLAERPRKRLYVPTASARRGNWR